MKHLFNATSGPVRGWHIAAIVHAHEGKVIVDREFCIGTHSDEPRTEEFATLTEAIAWLKSHPYKHDWTIDCGVAL